MQEIIQLVDFMPNFLTENEADELLAHSLALEWQHNQIKMFGKFLPLPRLEAMFGDFAYRYFYSGSVELVAAPWTAPSRPCGTRINWTFRPHI